MQVSAYEAKSKLPALLRRVADGEAITITKHGTPIAQILPMAPAVGNDRDAAIDALKTFAHGCTTGGISVREMKEEGRL